MDAYFRASRAALMAAGRNKLALAHAMVPTKKGKGEKLNHAIELSKKRGIDPHTIARSLRISE